LRVVCGAVTDALSLPNPLKKLNTSMLLLTQTASRFPPGQEKSGRSIAANSHIGCASSTERVARRIIPALGFGALAQAYRHEHVFAHSQLVGDCELPKKVARCIECRLNLRIVQYPC
jgi:hypothetical protein